MKKLRTFQGKAITYVATQKNKEGVEADLYTFEKDSSKDLETSVVKQSILNAVHAIDPFDEVERRHKADVLDWIQSGVRLFRISKPDNPPKHLVSYFVLYDSQTSQLMLVDHVKAALWLPPGGHVDVDEDPRTTVIREACEELQVTARFDTVFGRDPLFLTVTETRGDGKHTDVSLWYVIAGSCGDQLMYDGREMHGYKWLSLQNVLDTDISELDPHMHRFVRKLQAMRRHDD